MPRSQGSYTTSWYDTVPEEAQIGVMAVVTILAKTRSDTVEDSMEFVIGVNTVPTPSPAVTPIPTANPDQTPEATPIPEPTSDGGGEGGGGIISTMT